MEKLKSFSELLIEDPRFSQMMQLAAEEGEPRYSLERHYQRYAMLKSPRGAPEEIVNGFVTAQHLAIYSWFVYPFSSAAELQALVTLEHALRRRMSNEPARGLKQRLRHAVAVQWVRGDKLRKLHPYVCPIAETEFAQRPVDPDGAASLTAFIDNLPEQRNWLAHGNWVGGGDVFILLDIIVQLINQLYP
ncbi:MAG: hypothetical protein WCF88_15645 [Candidatus Acidiferrales bacterium]|jgi:hypothetical protein